MSTRVILIDDDTDTLEIFQDYLEMKGIEVVETGNNGKTAVELYLKHKPEIVLLDVMMPEYDGYFALKNILNNDTNAKIIMVTADKTADTRKKLIELKASGILYKPYEIKTVLETIEKVKTGENVLDMIYVKQKYTPLC